MHLDGCAYGESDRRRNTRSFPSRVFMTVVVRLASAASEGPRKGFLEQVQDTCVVAREEVCKGLKACLVIVLVWPTQCTSEPVRNIGARMFWC